VSGEGPERAHEDADYQGTTIAMGIRQVQVLLQRRARGSTRGDDADSTAAKDSETLEYDAQELAMQIMAVLQSRTHCLMPVLIGGTSHIVLQFRSGQKHLEATLRCLHDLGVGVFAGTRIDILDLTSTIPAPGSQVKGKKKRKYKVSDRMTTQEILEQVDSGSHLTFDFLAMTAVASLIAAVGLLTDSSVSVVASMLVSPLMGPIVATTFGIAVADSKLICRGIRNELFGLIVCILVGFFVGVATGPFYGPKTVTVSWATSRLQSFEIESRGTPWALLSGFFVAAPSGIGVALAITVGGVNALVGTAISAALLPPVVNSGLCLALALWYDGSSDSRDTEFFLYAGWSFCLFLLNFLMIICFALLVFKLKRIGPLPRKVALPGATADETDTTLLIEGGGDGGGSAKKRYSTTTIQLSTLDRAQQRAAVLAKKS
tara:strand:- start:647 stop:1942 length:1296 start_codon:yes stop_codon:yes gene_type:complete